MILTFCLLSGGHGAIAQTINTLEKVKARGHLECGVSQGVAGFSSPDSAGNWSGLDVDFCRALAAAIFNDPTKVRMSPLSATDRFTALQSGLIDVLARNTTWTLQRDTALGFNFGPITYFDGQGFMVKKSLNVKGVSELTDASICITAGTTHEQNVADYFRAHKMKFEPVVFGTADETVKAYDGGRCDVLTADASGLSAYRVKLQKPDEQIILPEIISKEPLGPAVRQGDDQWLDIVKWTHFAMLTAEELDITKANVDAMTRSDRPEVRRVLGNDNTLGQSLGLTADWVVRIIRHVGNYGEVFDRNLGPSTPMRIARGLNAQWTKGGLQYAPPIR
ncbi:amino acid ABC transporter substrate-binding protein [Bradyrhizobium sp. Rc3b]|uniref:amino acid ABC transporter substrate-binding protein n=1 Tax=Bradyrhizobium sp. Rc3b TaxID=1855322 RepID=UPI001FCDBED0|nr:amino acid ABC transporter substrate-binding protein [Bradyrhizobium sp. Rc3b]